jgi:hypothetical protein
MVGIWRGKAHQFGNGVRASLMDRGADRYFRGLEIQLASLVTVGENPSQLLF